MGIRYYAYPVDNRLVEIARQDPRAFVGEDPLMDAWGPLKDRPPMLYLDKAWGELQILLSRTSPTGRPASDLVAGNVIHTHEGWIPHFAVLDAATVAAIAADLATVSDSDVTAMVTAGEGLFPQDGADGEIDYVVSYLREAQAFCTELTELRQGLVYKIG